MNTTHILGSLRSHCAACVLSANLTCVTSHVNIQRLLVHKRPSAKVTGKLLLWLSCSSRLTRLLCAWTTIIGIPTPTRHWIASVIWYHHRHRRWRQLHRNLQLYLGWNHTILTTIHHSK